ncbi:MAG: oligosaccharide flippase family protein [Gaiellaceae bacterium]
MSASEKAAEAGSSLAPPGSDVEEQPIVASEIATATSAVRGGALVVASSAAGIAAMYLFLLGSGRLLGSADYGTLAALLGLLTVVLLPTSALQMAVSREVAHALARDETQRARAFIRQGLLLSLKATVPVLVLAFALLVPLEHVLRIHSARAMALALASLAIVFVWPFALGVLQGYQRFRALSVVSFAPLGGRLALLLGLAAIGLRLYGALAAVTLSSLGAAGLAVWAIRDSLAGGRRLEVESMRPFLRYLAPVVLGLLAIGLLTNIDLLVIKARFSAHEAGVYAAASAFARVVFFLPAAFLTVLFPRTAARQARGQGAGDILGRSVIVTFGFCAVVIGLYALLGRWLVRVSYGAEFKDATSLLVPFGAAMSALSLTNVLVGFHLSRGESRFAWLCAAGVVIQVIALATFPTTLRQALLVNGGVGAGLLVAHELAVESSMPALRAGMRRFRQQLPGRG